MFRHTRSIGVFLWGKHVGGMTDREYFAALKVGAANGDVVAAWTLAFAYAEGFVQRENGAWFPVRKNRPRGGWG